MTIEQLAAAAAAKDQQLTFRSVQRLHLGDDANLLIGWRATRWKTPSTPANGAISVEAKQLNNSMRLIVANSGPGIDPENLRLLLIFTVILPAAAGE